MPDKNKKTTNNDGFRNPHNLPTKICAACGKSFTWRKKWERDWESVRFCSDACRTRGNNAGAAPPLADDVRPILGEPEGK